MHLEQRDNGWWIVNIPETPDCGPYETRTDAKSDMRGMAQFFCHEDSLAFFHGTATIKKER